MFKLAQLTAVAAMTASLSAQAVMVTYSWEDGGTVLGQFDAGQTIQYTNTSALARTGSSSLLVEDLDSATSGTPQGYLAWITGLTDGDIVDASFWVYDTTSGAAPSARIWGHYTLGNDVNSYEGSASGNTTYSGSSDWSELSYSWTFDSDNGTRDGLMVEVRFYDSGSATTGALLVDDLTIDASAGFITTPTTVPVPAAAWLFGSAVAGLMAARRKRS